MKGERLVGQGRYKDLDGRSVFTHYERVDHTNLTAIVSIPMKVITGVADQHMQVALMIGVGAGLVGLLVSWFVSASFVAPAATAAMSTPAAPVTAPSAISAPPASVQNENSVVAPPAHERPPPITDNWHHQNSQDLQNERKLAFEAFDKSFATRLRGPILAILGHTQLIKAKSDNSPEIQAHAESVEREARTARETLDRIHILNETNSAPVPTETMDLDDVIAQALIEKDLELQAKGISVERSMAMLPRLTGRAEDFQVAIGNVIDNAMESMRERPRRRLVIKTEREEGFAVLSISDTGFGMSRDVQERAFEPFFKNFESPDHLGLGLAFVATVTRRSHGDVSLTSIPGDGTTLKMKFPLPPSQIKEVPQEVITEVAAPATRDMSVPRDLNTPPPLDDSPKPPPLPEETPTITLGGKAPLAGMSATILPPPPSENPVGQADDAGFKVQIRRPKPKG